MRRVKRRVKCGYHAMRLWLLDHLPGWLLAEPYGFLIALLCIVSGLPIVLRVNEPGPIRALLPSALVAGWGACLVFGGLAMLCGLTSIRQVPGQHHVVTRVPCYRLGLRLLAVASLIYAYSVASVAGFQAVGLVVILLLFAATNYLRLLTLGGR